MSMWEGKKVLVAGASGFLGAWICGELKISGADTVIRLAGRRSGDLRFLAGALEALNVTKPDIVINCAASRDDAKPAEVYDDNMTIYLNMMRAAYACGAKKYVNVISGCSYPSLMSTLREEDFFNGPPHPIVFQRAMAERASVVQARAYREQYGFNAISLALISLYGPGERFKPERSSVLGGLLRKFYEAKRDGLPKVVVRGSGSPICEWTYIQDAVQGILTATMFYDEPGILNIATGKGYSTSELAAIVKKAVGYEGKVAYDKSKSDGILCQVADTTKMRKCLKGWRPNTSLKDGIAKTLEWFDKNYDKAITR